MKVDRILKLARLETGKKEKKNLEKEFSAILDFVKKIEEIKVAKTKLAFREKDIKNIMREDKEQKTGDGKQTAEKLLELAPETKERYVRTKQIL